MRLAGDGPPLLTRAEVVIGNAIPVIGVAVLGWEAATTVFLYVLDGWLCILGLGASVMLQNRDEMRKMVPERYSRVRRALFWVAVVGLVEAILSAFALVPGVMILGHMGTTPADGLALALRDASVLVPVVMLAGSHAVRVARSVRDAGEGVWGLPPKLQMMLFTYRMFLMMFLAWLAAPGFLSRVLVPVYVAFIAALFTYSDLFPQRFLARVGVSASNEPAGDEGGGGGEERSQAGKRR